MKHWLQAFVQWQAFKPWAKQLWKDAPMRARQVLLVVAALVLLSFCTGQAFAAEPAPVWKLVRSNAVQSANYASPESCLTALYAAQVNAGQQITFRCQTTIVRRGVAPTPVNCVVSTWTQGPLVPASCPASGVQSRTDTRTVTTPASNGGTACPALTQTVSVPCTPPPPPTGAGVYTASAAAVTMVAPFARWPGYSSSTAGPIGNVSGGVSYDDDPRMVNGSTNGLYRETGAFAINVTAANGPLALYIGGWNSAGRLTVTQGGQTVYIHTAAASGSGPAWNGVYTLNLTGTYSVRWERASGAGNVTIQGAAIIGGSPPPPPVFGSAALTWQAPGVYTDGAPIMAPITYRVEYGRGDFTQTIGLSGTAAVVDQLSPGAWQFRVRALVNGVESEPSAVGAKVVP